MTCVSTSNLRRCRMRYVVRSDLMVPSTRTVRYSPRSLAVAGVLLYLRLRALTQKDQIRHGNTHGEGRVLEGQPRHCISTNASRGLSTTTEFLVLTALFFLFLNISNENDAMLCL